MARSLAEQTPLGRTVGCLERAARAPAVFWVPTPCLPFRSIICQAKLILDRLQPLVTDSCE